MRGQLASKITDLVDCHYGFVDRKEESMIQKNKDLCAKLKTDTAFYFRVGRHINSAKRLLTTIQRTRRLKRDFCAMRLSKRA